MRGVNSHEEGNEGVGFLSAPFGNDDHEIEMVG